MTDPSISQKHIRHFPAGRSNQWSRHHDDIVRLIAAAFVFVFVLGITIGLEIARAICRRRAIERRLSNAQPKG
jgi:hypothetical protein